LECSAIFIYETKKSGYAYYCAVSKSSFPDDSILSEDYYSIQDSEDEINYSTIKLFYARMDDEFESTLSNYRQTRQDSFGARHLHFKSPLPNYLADEDKEYSGIGNGIDIGRYVIGFQIDNSFLSSQLKGLTCIHNVHLTNNEYVETIFHTKWTHKTTEQLTTKFLLLGHDLPKTKNGIDPFIYSDATGDFVLNSAIEDGENPDLGTACLGAEYQFTNWLSTYSIWEYTNDVTIGADNYPRALLNSSNFTTITIDGKTYRQVLPFLYKQEFFDLLPYEYNHIFKTGVNIQPARQWNIYLDYTYNPNKFAGQIDNNINHAGIEISYIPSSQWEMLVSYIWTRTNDINKLVYNDEVVLRSYHNIFTELRYCPTETDQLLLQYGVSTASNLETKFIDAMPTLDTQHIIRLFYKKLF